jgi:glutaredoxin 3
MSNIVIYTKDYCPHCVKAKRLFESKGLNFKEVDITNDVQLQEECFAKSHGRKTVPQIFVNEMHIGGCDDLYAADANGRLAEILSK